MSILRPSFAGTRVRYHPDNSHIEYRTAKGLTCSIYALDWIARVTSHIPAHHEQMIPYVEQKNYSVVRRAVGYARYEGERERELVNELYDRLRLQINFFKPVMKMGAKERRGSRIWKKYDVPKTPYRRICESPEVAGKIKRELAQEYETLNPAQLARQIGWLQNCLLLKLTPEQKKRWEAGWM